MDLGVVGMVPTLTPTVFPPPFRTLEIFRWKFPKPKPAFPTHHFHSTASQQHPGNYKDSRSKSPQNLDV